MINTQSPIVPTDPPVPARVGRERGWEGGLTRGWEGERGWEGDGKGVGGEGGGERWLKGGGLIGWVSG